MLQWTTLCIYIFTLLVYLQGKFLEVRLLSQKANTHIVLLDIAKSSSVKTVPFSIPISSIWDSCFYIALPKEYIIKHLSLPIWWMRNRLVLFSICILPLWVNLNIFSHVLLLWIVFSCHLPIFYRIFVHFPLIFKRWSWIRVSALYLWYILKIFSPCDHLSFNLCIAFSFLNVLFVCFLTCKSSYFLCSQIYLFCSVVLQFLIITWKSFPIPRF